MSTSDTMQAASDSTVWKLAVYASVALWLATVAGNLALFAARPRSHWPLLETVEALQSASLIPVALLLHTFIKRSRLSLLLTASAVAAMAVGVGIGIAFATGAASFGEGFVGGPLEAAGEVVLLVWLLAANWLAMRLRTLPTAVALLGMASALTVTLVYPVWAIRLLRVYQGRQ